MSTHRRSPAPVVILDAMRLLHGRSTAARPAAAQ